ncbi:hypothetical protein CIL03_05410 [Virgibacillus indicus]|uniref:Uncharacterized protein n=1 Tax=Virgibacillus indicus TaxID=2024554 RepID=A0A265NFH7_9BACI|nr:hypothetical protein [Virgibacillus indicus]OZU90581.1 hypothetical protein CIL03_05410 [Virgibacillus indicus]
MEREINEQLVQTKEAIRRKAKWEKQMKDYQSELSEIESAIGNLEDQLSEELRDVKKLEGVSLTSLFQTFFGAKEEKLRKEKQEAAAVQLKLKEARKTEKELIDSINVLKEKVNNTGELVKKYNDLLLQKEAIIRKSNSSSANELFLLGDQEGDTRAYLIELKEAITAGEAVKSALEKAVSSLDSAEGWGALDMFGGGMISGLVKHDHIDKSTGFIHQAQSRMRTFQKELLDIDQAAEMHVDISGMLKFADFFFDGLLTDWMVQGRIQDSLAQVRDQQAKIAGIIRNLKMEVEKNEDSLEEIEVKKEAVIVGY